MHYLYKERERNILYYNYHNNNCAFPIYLTNGQLKLTPLRHLSWVKCLCLEALKGMSGIITSP